MTIRPLRLIISAATVIVLLVGTFSIQLGFRTGIGKAEAKSLTNASLSPTLSVSSNLANRRYAAAGDRAYDLGSEDGRFPAMGFHTRGEMGGIWTPPIKLLDGGVQRSEEHTSELQSLAYLVCRLLLEKKNKI